MIFYLCIVVINFSVNLTRNLVGSFFWWLFLLLRFFCLWLLLLDKSKSLDNDSDESCFLYFQCFFFLSRSLLLDFLCFLSSDKLDFLDDASNDDGSDSGSYDTCAFPFSFDKFLVISVAWGLAFFPI